MMTFLKYDPIEYENLIKIKNNGIEIAGFLFSVKYLKDVIKIKERQNDPIINIGGLLFSIEQLKEIIEKKPKTNKMSKVQDLIKKAKEAGIRFQEVGIYMSTSPDTIYYYNTWTDKDMVNAIEEKLKELENKTWFKYIKDEKGD